MLGVKTLTTTALIPSRTILIVGTMLRATPNTAHRHFETFERHPIVLMTVSDSARDTR